MKKYYRIIIFVLACMQISYADDFKCIDFKVNITKQKKDNLYHWKLHKHNQYELVYENIEEEWANSYKFTNAYLYNIEKNEVVNEFEYCVIYDDPNNKKKKIYKLIDLDKNKYNLNGDSPPPFYSPHRKAALVLSGASNKGYVQSSKEKLDPTSSAATGFAQPSTPYLDTLSLKDKLLNESELYKRFASSTAKYIASHSQLYQLMGSAPNYEICKFFVNKDYEWGIRQREGLVFDNFYITKPNSYSSYRKSEQFLYLYGTLKSFVGTNEIQYYLNKCSVISNKYIVIEVDGYWDHSQSIEKKLFIFFPDGLQIKMLEIELNKHDMMRNTIEDTKQKFFELLAKFPKSANKIKLNELVYNGEFNTFIDHFDLWLTLKKDYADKNIGNLEVGTSTKYSLQFDINNFIEASILEHSAAKLIVMNNETKTNVGNILIVMRDDHFVFFTTLNKIGFEISRMVINEGLKKTDNQVLSIDQKRILAIMEKRDDLSKKTGKLYKPNVTETAIVSKSITIGATAIVAISHFKVLPCEFTGVVSLGFQTKSDPTKQSISNVPFETNNSDFARSSRIYMNTIQGAVLSVINSGTKKILKMDIEQNLKYQLMHGVREDINGFISISFQGHSPITYKVNQCTFYLTDELQYKLVYNSSHGSKFSIISPEFTIIYNQFNNTYSLDNVYLGAGDASDFELLNKPINEPMKSIADSETIF